MSERRTVILKDVNGEVVRDIYGNIVYVDEKVSLYEILVPTMDNDGKPFRLRYHKVWDAKVKEITGGLTIMKPVKGIWEYEGTTYEERNIPVRVACYPSDLEKILKLTKDYYSQIKIMAYKVSDEVIFYG